MKARSILSACVVALALALPAVASASTSTTTLGSIVAPAGGPPGGLPCSGTPFLFGMATSADDVGTGGGLVTSWSVNATGDSSGTETLYVLAPDGSDYTVVGTDTETIPTVIPADGTVTFTLASPIAAESGDTFAVSASGAAVFCGWISGSNEAFLANLAGAGVGQSIVPVAGPGLVVDLAVTLTPRTQDVAVSTTAGPSNALVNNEALLSSTVTNNGPSVWPTTFTDAVPAGLAIDGVAAAGGDCSTAGQVVTCTFGGLAVGASALVEIVVTPAVAQSYENTVFVADASPVTDPNPANNSASASLVVAAPVAPTSATPTSATPASLAPAATVTAARACVATNLKGLSEKVVKTLLPALGCEVGKIKKATSRHVAKGDVISLTPASGSHAAGTKVALTVSSGKPKKKHKG
jgi:Domain of unknown function DUF11/PASTA domain